MKEGRSKLVKFKFWIAAVATVIGNIQCKNILKLFPRWDVLVLSMGRLTLTIWNSKVVLKRVTTLSRSLIKTHKNGTTFYIFLTGIHSMQCWTATTRNGVTRKRSTKRLNHTGNLFRKNVQLKYVQPFQLNIYQNNTFRKDSTMNQRFRRGSKCRTNIPTYPFLWLLHIFTFTILSSTTVLQKILWKETTKHKRQ